MSVANIASKAVARETCFPWILAKLAIFATDMLWKSCSEINLEQLSHSMFCKNIASLAVAMETCVPWYWPNEQYSYRTYYGKVVQNQILNNFPIACL